jgi:protein SCO1
MSKFPPGIQENFVPFVQRVHVDWRVLAGAFALVLAVIASLLATRCLRYRNVRAGFYGQALSPGITAYDFHLIDQNGQAFRLSQLHGKLVLFAFGYTHCPNIRPTTLSDLAAIYRTLPEKARGKVQILFITIDPGRDQPEMLKRYVPYFDPSFLGLTGSDEQTTKAAHGYGASFGKVQDAGDDPQRYRMDHSTFTYLINPEGKWELLYDFNKLRNTERMITDIEEVLDGF